MKFKFKIQDYQTEAVDSVVRVFQGQPYKSGISYLRDLGDRNTQVILTEDEVSDGNGFENGTIDLSDTELLDNIRAVQLDGNIKQSDDLSRPFGPGCRCSLDIDMETGTGKTYVYTKTIFELNKIYGWSKFIVVVPSIAIREGVKKSFEQTEEHFFEHYGKKARCFIYNSKNLNQIDSFSASKDIYVMIINAQAFNTSLKEDANNEAARIIYSKQDSFASRRPIDVIAANHPIMILDEPQKLGGAATQNGIKRFKPLFTLNYSATHRETHNLIYVLDAFDAYKRKLVKKIEVKGLEVRNLPGANGYLYLSEIRLSPDKPPQAIVSMEINRSGNIKRESRTVRVGDNLYDLSAGNKNSSPLEQYKNGYVVTGIEPLNDSVSFMNGLTLSRGEFVGDMSEKDMRRVQIRETILSHFEKEATLYERGIKCLSLFFIDHVENYRQYSDDGEEILGEYGRMFEEEYSDILKDYESLETPYARYLKGIDVRDTHKGYFSIDKKTGRCIDSVEKRDGCDDISAYDLILKNKERLLSFDEPTRFIFSHSALREGWDNPNVFQICTLKQSNSDINKRQEVGRGMRLCVNSYGDRMDGTVSGISVHDINVLTVIASDSYRDYVGNLQSELKRDLYERPARATKDYFAGKVVAVNGERHTVTDDEANLIMQYLIRNDYVDYDGKVTDKYRDAQETGEYAALPDKISALGEGVQKLVQGIYDEKALDEIVTSARGTKIYDNGLNDNFYKSQFQDLWKRINHKYAYTVSFDSGELIEKSVKAIDKELSVPRVTYTRTTGRQGEGSLDFTEEESSTSVLKNAGGSSVEYDLIGKIADGTKLTRKTACEILKGISAEKFDMFSHNPERFISEAVRLINEQKATMIVEKIEYNITDEEPYSSDIFTMDHGVIDTTKALEVKRHVTPYVVVDSEVESEVAQGLDNEDSVTVYAHLPRAFKIPTPVGDYSPDWAIVFNEEGVRYIYFVAETKGTMSSMQLRPVERAKIDCTRKLFEKLSDGKIKYRQADSFEELMNVMTGSGCVEESENDG